MSSGPMPPASYAFAAARGTASSGPCLRPVRTALARTRTSGPPAFCAASRVPSTSAAAPSEIGEHMNNVNGSTIIRLASTSSALTA